MLHQKIEDFFDTMVLIGIIIGFLFFFIIYWNGKYEIRFLEIVVQEFLTKVSNDGEITSEEYEKLIRNIERTNSKFSVEITCSEFVNSPVYALIPKEELIEYYMSRNVKQEIILPLDKPQVEEKLPEQLCFQTETNETILAGMNQEYLPMPDETTEWRVEAVRSCQEVYEGEPLITLCRVESEEGICYMEAEAITAEESGEILLTLQIKDNKVFVPVEVLCHPRTIVCARGHVIVNSKDIIEEVKQTGCIRCPYCYVLPEEIKSNTSVLHKQAGSDFQDEELWITVKYLDGRTEKITSEMPDWKDTYDKNYCGIQTVVLQYRGEQDVIMVITENEPCHECQRDCNERNYSDYMRFPYCIECLSRVPLFTGKIYEEERKITYEELFMCMNQNGKVGLSYGSFVTVLVSKNEKNKIVLQKKIMKNGK